MSTNFAVVEFIGEKSVDIVLESWIETREGSLYCYYPRTNVAGRVRKLELPDKENWSSYRIRVLSYTDKHEKAKKQLKQAEHTSNLDTSDSESDLERPNKRQRGNINYADTELTEGDEENIDPSRNLSRKKTLQSKGKSTGSRSKKSSLTKTSQASTDFCNLALPSPPDYQRRKSNDQTRMPCNNLLYPDRQSVSCPSSSSRVNRFESAELVGDSLRILASQPCDTSIQNNQGSLASQPCDTLIQNNQGPFFTSQRVDNNDSFTSLLDDLRSPFADFENQNHSTSTMEPRKHHSETNQNFKTSVLMKLDSIIENQKEILVHLRHQNVGIERTCNGDLDDSLARPMNALNEVEELCGKVEQAAFAKTLVNYLAAQCGHTCGDTVRRIMAKLGTNQLWSLFSFKGRKGKKSFKSLSLCNTIIKACMKSHPKATELSIEEHISETLKHAPNKPGGSRYRAMDKSQEKDAE
ncbi:Hypothetical predicted protein [Paramuricea clavata]|uniref:Uncharacterized protein n=1 Tax=Paramuricea clavata TaxID=317549 RepID=A0A7D9ITI7_PARCT|nr:Hypothetical predicted protein [Paramuricea clavata]